MSNSILSRGNYFVSNKSKPTQP